MKFHILFTALFLIFSSCTHKKSSNELSQEELNRLYIDGILNVRPILKSDEMRFMNCDFKKDLVVTRKKRPDYELWKKFGDLELRRQARDVGANILILNHTENNGIDTFAARAYECEKVASTNEVVNVGMCKESEAKIFTLDFDRELFRELGEVILIEKIKYHAISNHYKSYYYKNLKYSFTQQKFTAEAFFYKCY